MAERVEVRGGDLDGSILENAASEATLLRLVELVESSSSRRSGSGGNNIASDRERARLQDLYNRSLRQSNVGVEKLGESAKTAATSISSLAKGTLGLITGLAKLIDSTVSSAFNIAFATNTPKLTQMTDALTSIIPINTLGTFGHVLEGMITDFRDLSQVGADLGTGLTDIKLRAVEANLPLEVYKKVITENARDLSALGGSVNQGARRFTQISGEVQKLRPQFARLGFSMEETAEFTASYLDQQRRLGRIESMSTDQLAKGAQNYNFELDRLARATGLQRRSIDDANKQVAADTRMRNALSKLETSERNRLNAGLRQLEEEGRGQLVTILRDMIGGVGVPLTDSAKSFAVGLKAIGIDLAPTIQDMFRGVPGSVARFEEQIRTAAERMNDLDEPTRRFITQTMTMGKELPPATAAYLQGLQKFGLGHEDAANSQKTALSTTEKSLANLDGVLLDIRNAVTIAMIPALKALELAGANLVIKLGPGGELIKSIEQFAQMTAQRMKEFIDTLGTQGANEAFRQLWEDLKNYGGPYLQKMFEDLKPYAQAGINTLFTAVIPMVGEGLLSLFTSPVAAAALAGAISLLFAKSAIIRGARDVLRAPGDAIKATKDAVSASRNKGPTLPGDSLKQGTAAGAGALLKRLGLGAAKFIPGVGLLVGAGETIHAAYNASETLGLPIDPKTGKPRSATAGETAAAGAGGLVSAATLGIISPEKAAKFFAGLTGAGSNTSASPPSPKNVFDQASEIEKKYREEVKRIQEELDKTKENSKSNNEQIMKNNASSDTNISLMRSQNDSLVSMNEKINQLNTLVADLVNLQSVNNDELARARKGMLVSMRTGTLIGSSSLA